MVIHEIHDLTDNYVVSVLTKELSKVTDLDIQGNYNPDFKDQSNNLFFILDSGRYKKGMGKYYVVEDNGKLICSAGWNVYNENPNIALGLTRAFVSPEFRGQYPMAKYILPKIIDETINYSKLWITVNEHNKTIYQWFVRASQNKKTAMFNDWPEIYRKFKPLDQMTIYNTKQYVIELERTKMTDQEKLDFLKNAITTLFKKNPKVEITPEASLLDIGLDSLDIVELQMHYEEVHGVETATDARVKYVKDLMALMK